MSDGIEPSQPHLCTELYLHRHNWLGCYNWFIVGILRFELRTSCSQSRHTNRTVLHPEFSGFYKLVLIFLLTLIMFLPRFKFIVNILENCFVVPSRIKFMVLQGLKRIVQFVLQLERVIGIEPTSRPWKGHILTVVLYSQNLCGIGRIRTYSAIRQQIYSLSRLSNCGAIPLLPLLGLNQGPFD